MGGYGTYTAALDHPDKIAAIVPLCRGINDSDTTRICTIKNIPILTYHGMADQEISIHETQRIAESLKKCNGNIIFHRLTGKGRGIQYLYETEPWIYEWLLMQRKETHVDALRKGHVNAISKHWQQKMIVNLFLRKTMRIVRAWPIR